MLLSKNKPVLLSRGAFRGRRGEGSLLEMDSLCQLDRKLNTQTEIFSFFELTTDFNASRAH